MVVIESAMINGGRHMRELFSYIDRFSGERFVVKIDDRLLKSDMFGPLIQDLGQLSKIGVRLMVVAGVLSVVFLISLIRIFWISRATMTAMLVLPLVSTSLTAVATVATALVWWRKSGSVLGRVYFSLVVLQGALFVLFLNYWNFIGFRFG